MERYKDKTILITGASSGIGEAFAKRLDQLGANLILTARSENKLISLAETMHNAIVISGDLSNPDFPKKLYQQVKERGQIVDILINNAGFGFSGLFLESSIDNYQDMLNVNVNSLTQLTHLFLADMVDRGAGGIINISSLASYQPMPYFAIYAATKSYVTSFTIAIYEEYKEKGINVLGVCPGYTKTNFNKRALMSSKPVAGYSMSAEAVVEESLKSYLKGKPIIINGFTNRFVKRFMSLLPSSVALKMTKYIIKKGLDSGNW